MLPADLLEEAGSVERVLETTLRTHHQLHAGCTRACPLGACLVDAWFETRMYRLALAWLVSDAPITPTLAKLWEVES